MAPAESTNVLRCISAIYHRGREGRVGKIRTISILPSAVLNDSRRRRLFAQRALGRLLSAARELAFTQFSLSILHGPFIRPLRSADVGTKEGHLAKALL